MADVLTDQQKTAAHLAACADAELERRVERSLATAADHLRKALFYANTIGSSEKRAGQVEKIKNFKAPQ